MKKKLMLIISIFFITSLIICQSTIISVDSLYKEIFNDNYQILENGVKLQYYTSNALEDEKNRIIKILSLSNYNEKVDKGSVFVNGNKGNAKFEIKGSLNNKENFIEVQVIEKNNRININNLQQKLSKIKSHYTKDERYFTFAKGKLIKNSDENFRLNNLFEQKKVETIPISSGITSIAKVKNKFHINYSLCNYDSGTYLVVGTPIIFIEY